MLGYPEATEFLPPVAPPPGSQAGAEMTLSAAQDTSYQEPHAGLSTPHGGTGAAADSVAALRADLSSPASAAGLPAGWVERVSRTQGRKYYLNVATSKATWTLPEGATPADAGHSQAAGATPDRPPPAGRHGAQGVRFGSSPRMRQAASAGASAPAEPPSPVGPLPGLSAVATPVAPPELPGSRGTDTARVPPSPLRRGASGAPVPGIRSPREFEADPAHAGCVSEGELQGQLEKQREDLMALLGEERRRAAEEKAAAEEASRRAVAALEAETASLRHEAVTARCEAATGRVEGMERAEAAAREARRAAEESAEKELSAFKEAMAASREAAADARSRAVTAEGALAAAKEEAARSRALIEEAAEEAEAAGAARRAAEASLQEAEAEASAAMARAEAAVAAQRKADAAAEASAAAAEAAAEAARAARADAAAASSAAPSPAAAPAASEEEVRALAVTMAESDPGVRADAERRVAEELRPEVRAELRAELRRSVAASLREELRADVRAELRAELDPAVRSSARKEAAEAGRAEAEARALETARETVRAEMREAVAAARAEASREASREAEEAVRRVDERVEGARRAALEAARREAEAAAESMRAAVQEAEARWRREAALRRKAHNWALELAGNVRVFARVRPVLGVERRQGAGAADVAVLPEGDEDVVVRADEDAEAGQGASRRVRGARFQFDRVFGPGSTQGEVFDEVEPLVVSCLDGYNATVFAYGQTGSGKTYTMHGDDAGPGVTPRTLGRLLEAARERAASERRTTSLELSVLEVYNEEVRDLLAGAPGRPADGDGWKEGGGEDAASASSGAGAGGAGLLFTQVPSRGKLDARRDPSGAGTFVPGLARVALRSLADADAAMRHAAESRAVGAHSMNLHSSRSHLVVTVYATAPPAGERGSGGRLPGLASKLHIIDLAGSERVAKTDASGSRLKEAQAINKSLSALGNVMEALAAASPADGAGRRAAGAAGRHVPYRDSKLTFLLEDSLRGGSKVLMFANVSPARYNAPESTTSLRFATRCRAVQLGKATKLGAR